MANLEDLRAEIDINESDLHRIQMGQDAEVVPDAYPERAYAARVVKLYPQVNRQKGTLKIEVQIPHPDEKLLPDMSVRIDFLTEALPCVPLCRIESSAGRIIIEDSCKLDGCHLAINMWGR